MERARLQAARIRKQWTLKEAAARLETDANTLNRWELGKSKPRTYSVRLLCAVYGSSAYDLDLSDEPPVLDLPSMQTGALRQLIGSDLTICLLALPIAHAHSPSGILLLQGQVRLVVEEFDLMNTDDTITYPITRRQALRQLALIPIQVLSLRTALSPPEELLRQCAAGITACEYLGNGVDLPLAAQIVSGYLPALTAIVHDSSVHRMAAAHLATQCLFLQTILATHLEGIQQAVHYAQQAIAYSKVSGDAAVQITAYGRLAWVYSCQKQKRLALEQALKGRTLLHDSLHPSVQSYSFGVLAKYQALMDQRQEALTSLRRAHETFFASDQQEAASYMDHDLSNFLLDDGTTYLYMGKPEEALGSFAQLIDPGSLHARVPMAERIRVEVLNSQTTASLKLPRKDMDLTVHFWEAAISGAKTLKSEQRFSEACAAFEVMECVWSGERRIETLREQTQHW